MEKLEDLTKSDPARVRCISKAYVKSLIRDANGNVIGVDYEKDGKVSQEYGPVILATGGYAVRFFFY
jgi:succinate dehydrogenase/fumarate reductase flavoprotein subunit